MIKNQPICAFGWVLIVKYSEKILSQRDLSVTNPRWGTLRFTSEAWGEKPASEAVSEQRIDYCAVCFGHSHCPSVGPPSSVCCYSSTLKTEAACYSEILEAFYRNMQHNRRRQSVQVANSRHEIQIVYACISSPIRYICIWEYTILTFLRPG